jgi:septum formation protein
MKIILGSSSPRRKEILSRLGCTFEIQKPDTDESVLDGETAHEYCLRVAIEKRESLAAKISTHGDLLLISSDTTVSYEDHILGKPTDHTDAVRMLTLLQGNTHQVLSSLAIYVRVGNSVRRFQGTESTDVVFKHLTRDGIETYLSSLEYMDKAGSYAAQECGDMIISKITGSVTNVIGFPLRLFFRMTEAADITDLL